MISKERSDVYMLFGFMILLWTVSMVSFYIGISYTKPQEIKIQNCPSVSDNRDWVSEPKPMIPVDM